MAMVEGIAYDHHIDAQIARDWTISMLNPNEDGRGAPYLYAHQLRGMIAARAHYHFVNCMRLDDFKWGLWLGLCDHFNGGCEIEDVSPECAILLGLSDPELVRPAG